MKIPLPCKFCGDVQEVDLTMEQINEIQKPRSVRRHIQDIIPEHPAHIRELFISGMCKNCWEDTFGPAPQ